MQILIPRSEWGFLEKVLQHPKASVSSAKTTTTASTSKSSVDIQHDDAIDTLISSVFIAIKISIRS